MSSKSIAFKFKPFSRKQIKVLTWWLPTSPAVGKDIIIADGAVRSGKTVSMALSFVLWSMSSFNGQSFGMAGKTIKSFERNVLIPLKQMLRTLNFYIVEHRSDSMIEIVQGHKRNSYYIFGGKDESSQDLIQGITLAGLLLDEVALMPQSFVNQATARCSVDGARMWFNCNPDGPAHWFYKEYIKDDPKPNALHLHFTMDDNLSLSPVVKQRYEELYSGVFYDRFIRGLWSVADGAVYGEAWSDDLLFDDDDLEPGIRNNKRYKRYILIDYGIVNPTAYLNVIDDGKTWWLMDEWVYGTKDEEKQMTVGQLADELDKFVGNYELRPRYLVIDPSAAALKVELRKRRNLGAIREVDEELINANNRVLEGIQKVASAFKKRIIRVHKRCVHCREEVTSYVWDSDAIAKGQPERVVKLNDHTMDALRYGVHTLLSERRILLA